MISPKKITFNNKSNEDFGLICDLCFEGGDNGETSSFLSRKAVTTETYNGAFRRSYGMKYDEVLAPQFTLMKRDFEDFTFEEQRAVLAWLTSKHTASYMDIYMTDDNITSNSPTYCLLGSVTEVETYKIGNNRTVGIIFTFESLYPYALSDNIAFSNYDFNNKTTSDNLKITCNTDDIESFVYPTMVISFVYGNCNLEITNRWLKGEENITDIISIKGNTTSEIVTIDSANKIITSNNTSRVLGENFSWIWPRLYYGDNNITFKASGDSSKCPIIFIGYRYPIKCGQF